MTPKLTIITPSLNQAGFIERTLESVFAQDCQHLEYFVVDGGSTDGSVEILERYSDRLAWWVSEPDDGQTHALNKGLERARGDIVAFINSDDYYLPGAFHAVVDALEHSDASWAVGAARFVDTSGRLLHLWRPEHPTKPRHRWVLDPWGVPQPATFWRRSLFERYGGFREDLHFIFDIEFGLRLVFARELPELIDRELAVRVEHAEAKSANRANFDREEGVLVKSFRNALSPSERSRLAVTHVLKRAAMYRARRRATTSRMA